MTRIQLMGWIGALEVKKHHPNRIKLEQEGKYDSKDVFKKRVTK